MKGLRARWSGAAGRTARETRALMTRLRVGAGQEPPRRRILWIGVALVLVAGPTAFNLARTSTYAASVDLFPSRVPPYPVVRDVGYWRAFLEDAELHREMRQNAEAEPGEYDDSELRTRSRPLRLRLTVEAGTPDRARRLVNALAPQLVGASSRQLDRQVDEDLARERSRPRSGSRRSRLFRTRLAGLRRLARMQPLPSPRAVLGPRAARTSVRGWADEIADFMPGDLSGRPSPVWAGLSGLLLAVTLWATALVTRPPRR